MAAKKCRIYAVFGVSQTPICFLLGKERFENQMKMKKQTIRKGIGKVLVILLLCLLVAGVVYAKDTETKEAATTTPGMEMLGEEVGSATLLEDGETLEEYLEKQETKEKEERSTLGSTCYISWGEQIISIHAPAKGATHKSCPYDITT